MYLQTESILCSGKPARERKGKGRGKEGGNERVVFFKIVVNALIQILICKSMSLLLVYFSLVLISFKNVGIYFFFMKEKILMFLCQKKAYFCLFSLQASDGHRVGGSFICWGF